jgi:hypothetical protein
MDILVEGKIQKSINTINRVADQIAKNRKWYMPPSSNRSQVTKIPLLSPERGKRRRRKRGERVI